MKKVLFTLVSLVFSMATFAQTFADENTVSVEDFNIKQGKTATFEINLNNTADNLVGWEFELELPEGWTLTETGTTTRTAGYSINPMLMGGYASRYYVGAFIAALTPISGTSGAFMTVTIQAPDDAVIGSEHNLKLEKVLFSSGEKYPLFDAEFTVTVVEDALVLNDTDEQLPAASTETKVIINRAFEGGKWNSFVAPFDISAAQYEAAFGDDVKVAKFDDQDIDDPDAISIKFVTVQSTPANTPVIIMPSANLTQVVFTGDIEVMPDEENAVVEVGGKRDRSYMWGVYVPRTLQSVTGKNESFPLYLKNNKFWYAPAEGVQMKGYRAYIEMIENPSAYTDQFVKMYIDEDLTAINGIDVNRTNEKVYTVDGKYVGKDVNFNRMQKGVYIVNGKKVIK